MKILHILTVPDGTAGVKEELLYGDELNVEVVRALFPDHTWCEMDKIEEIVHLGRPAVRVELAQEKPFTYITHLFIEM